MTKNDKYLTNGSKYSIIEQSPRARAAETSGDMRVITGAARGRRLEAPEGPETRPTAERTKEALFSAIQFEIEGMFVLDLFAGSGQLGIEALSRGARGCVFVDASREASDVVLRNLAHCGLKPAARVVTMDALAYLHGCRDTFQLAMLDPPYLAGLLPEVLPLVAAHMDPAGVIVCETAAENDPPPERAGAFAVYKTYKHGKALLTLYRRAETENE